MKKTLLSLLLVSAPLAAEPQLFVRNQPFAGPVRWFPARTLAPLDGLLESLGCSWQVDQGKLQVSCQGQGGPALKEILPISLEGRTVRLEQHIQQDRIFVDVDQVAAALQCSYRKGADGTVDLYGPLLSQGLGQGALRGSSDDPSFPVHLEKVQLTPMGGVMRGFARLKHQGQDPFKWVLVRVAVYEKSGRQVARCTELVKDLKPGAEAFVQFPKLVGQCQNPVMRVEFEAR
ncbi:MAG: hypothetical protein KF760_11080 [Candidatus Eremiobacteraeota bacterium]|nr:hypothetical protein [Candidatus Eremiobacteraeota bacterium]MCW5871730.1 hypothetical protein [Candidatus Eremiobacteraeota bacterium]